MTRFEIERLEAAFDYLDNKLIDRYSDTLNSDDPERVKKGEKSMERYAMAYQEVKNALEAFGFFSECDAKISERAFNDPENSDHVFAFSVSCKYFANEEHRQAGANAEQAEHFLRTHLAFNHVSMDPDEFEIKLLGQIC